MKKRKRAHVNFGFWRGPQLKDPHGLLEGDGERMRHVKIASSQDVRIKEFQQFVEAAAQLTNSAAIPTKRG